MERLPGESEAAHTALLEYWNMQGDRSLANLHKCIVASHTEKKSTGKPPNFGTIRRWSSVYKWTPRLEAADRLKASGVVQEIHDDYLTSVNRLRLQTQKIGEDIFAESRAQLQLISDYREKLIAENRVTGNELRSLSSSLSTIATTADTATGMVARAMGIDKIMESLMQKSE